MRRSSMVILNPAEGNVTLINTFAVKSGKADALVALLKEATEQTVRKVPGFVSANLHVSLDAKKVVNYAQWASKEQFEAAMKNPAFQKHMEKVKELIESFDPVLYQLVYSEAV
jgi:quinol monooxygenase YgiN